MGYEGNRKVKEDTKMFGLSNRKERIAIYEDEEDKGRVDLGREKP